LIFAKKVFFYNLAEYLGVETVPKIIGLELEVHENIGTGTLAKLLFKYLKN